MSVSDPMPEAFYEDRIKGRRLPVRLDIEGEQLRIIREDGRELDRWRLRDIAAMPVEPDGEARFGLAADAHAALLPADAGALAALLRQDGRPARRETHRHRRDLPLIVWIGGAALSTVLLLLFVLPLLAGVLAPMVPDGIQRRLGDQVADVATMMLTQSTVPRECVAPEGKAALDKLAALLPQGDIPPYRLRVIKARLPNAFAVPGHIVVTDGILEMSPTPEAALAVMAHELGHIVHGHSIERVMRYTLSSTLVSLVIGDFGGGFLAVAVGHMVEAGFSQDQEREADAYAAGHLRRIGYAPAAMAALFEKMHRQEEAGSESRLEAWFSSHPLLSERIARLKALPPPDRAAPPALEEGEWRALRRICAAQSDPPND